MRRDPILEAEEFEKHLKELSMLSPEGKKIALQRINQREKEYAKRHAAMNEIIERDRAARAMIGEDK